MARERPLLRVVVSSTAKTCGECGSGFTCGMGGPCWCADLGARRTDGVGDCLCPACLAQKPTLAAAHT